MMRVLVSLWLVFLPVLVRSDSMATVVKQILTPDGVTFNLNAATYEVYGLTELGPPQVKLFTHRVPGQPGMVLDNILDQPRTFTISHVALGVADIEGGLAAMNDVLANYRYNRTATIQPLRLRVTVGGVAAEIFCYYGGSIVKTVDNKHILFGFTLIAPDPYWYATTETSVTDIGADSLAVSYILGKVDGAWTAMGNDAAGGVYAIVADANDDLYIGFNGNNWGDANGDGVVLWNGAAVSSLGTGVDGVVADFLLDAEGNIWAVGTFQSAGGVANTKSVAKWNVTSGAWEEVDGGVDTAVIWVHAIVADSQGNVYIGGEFLSVGGDVDCNYIAKWTKSTDTWAAVGAAGLDALVTGLAIDASDNLYIVGGFTDVDGGPTGTYNRIIKWDGSAYSALGTGLNGLAYDVVVDSSGAVYVGGVFATADGVTVNKVAKWNGQTFESMDSGVNDDIYYLGVAPNDDIWVSGEFTTVGSDSLAAGRIARWNGKQWNRADFTLPGTPIVRVFAWDSEENFYVGFDTAGEALVSKIQDVTLAGNKPFPPTIEVGGPGTLVTIRNETTLQEIPFDLYVNDGETVTVDLGDPGAIPGGIQITSDWAGRPNGNNLLGKARAPSSLALFELVPDPEAASGVNKIGVFVTGQPVEAGDNNTQLSRYAGITGLDTTNTDDGRLYFDIVDEGGGDYHVIIWDDSARSSQVGHTGTYSGAGSEAVVADGASGLGGTIYIDAATDADVDITVDFSLVTIKHWNRFGSLAAAVD